jgi:hypothetical protein
MGKINQVILVIALLVAVLGLSANPAWAAQESTIHFLGVDYISGKGLIIYFDAPEGFEFDTFEKNVVVNGVQFALDCHFNGNKLLVCIAGVKKDDIGNKALINLGGREFEAEVPEANVKKCNSSFTYGVYDYGPDAIPWGLIGTVTQPCQALVGDTIVFYNANWAGLTVENGYFNYTYVPSGVAACAPNFGDGYYYDDC